MKKLFLTLGCLLAPVLLLTGCSTTKQPAYRLFSGETQQYLILTSTFDDSVKKLVEDKLGIKTAFMGPKISPAILRAVDNMTGSSVMPNIGRTFNNRWNGQFELEVLPGPHQLVLMPDYYLASEEDQITIPVDLKAQRRYFVGQVLEILRSPVGVSGIYISRGKYRWIPVIVDKTKMKLIYPEGK